MSSSMAPAVVQPLVAHHRDHLGHPHQPPRCRSTSAAPLAAAAAGPAATAGSGRGRESRRMANRGSGTKPLTSAVAPRGCRAIRVPGRGFSSPKPGAERPGSVRSSPDIAVRVQHLVDLLHLGASPAPRHRPRDRRRRCRDRSRRWRSATASCRLRRPRPGRRVELRRNSSSLILRSEAPAAMAAIRNRTWISTIAFRPVSSEPIASVHRLQRRQPAGIVRRQVSTICLPSANFARVVGHVALVLDRDQALARDPRRRSRRRRRAARRASPRPGCRARGPASLVGSNTFFASADIACRRPAAHRRPCPARPSRPAAGCRSPRHSR